jgi:hypothetical protein
VWESKLDFARREPGGSLKRNEAISNKCKTIETSFKKEVGVLNEDNSGLCAAPGALSDGNNADSISAGAKDNPSTR